MGLNSLKSKLKQTYCRFRTSVPAGHLFYYGEYHHGKAQFVYTSPNHSKSPADMVFDGSFKFKRYANGNTLQKAAGHFKQNKRDGEWAFEQNSDAVNSHLAVTYQDGHLLQDISLVRLEMGINSVLTSELYFTVQGGQIVGNIEGCLKNHHLEGQCDDDGLPHGTWELHEVDSQNSNVIYSEKWQHGQLVECKGDNKQQLLVDHVNYLIEDDCQVLLDIVHRGSQETISLIPYHLS